MIGMLCRALFLRRGDRMIACTRARNPALAALRARGESVQPCRNLLELSFGRRMVCDHAVLASTGSA